MDRRLASLREADEIRSGSKSGSGGGAARGSAGRPEGLDYFRWRDQCGRQGSRALWRVSEDEANCHVRISRSHLTPEVDWDAVAERVRGLG